MERNLKKNKTEIHIYTPWASVLQIPTAYPSLSVVSPAGLFPYISTWYSLIHQLSILSTVAIVVFSNLPPHDGILFRLGTLGLLWQV